MMLLQHIERPKCCVEDLSSNKSYVTKTCCHKLGGLLPAALKG